MENLEILIKLHLVPCEKYASIAQTKFWKPNKLIFLSFDSIFHKCVPMVMLNLTRLTYTGMHFNSNNF